MYATRMQFGPTHDVSAPIFCRHGAATTTAAPFSRTSPWI